MVDVLHFYMDDSGTRHPDHKIGRVAKHGNDWFSLGGVLLDQKDQVEAYKLHSDFCNKWGITKPLHSSEIRSMTGNFRFLKFLVKGKQEEFYEELYVLLRDLPVIGIACVIDRPGYNERYREKYGRKRWSLCKTAFSVSVERAAKYAVKKNMKLKVFPEKSDKKTDKVIKIYYKELKENGMPFSDSTSDKYSPLTKKTLNDTLYDFKCKNKKSPMVQIADLYIWIMSIGGYDKANKPYVRLVSDGKLVDSCLNSDEVETQGTKYSCFDEIGSKKD